MRAAAVTVRPCGAGSARFLAAAATALALACGCGGSPEPVAEAMPYADPGFVVGSGLRMHYALTESRDLPASIAASYGIEQRRNLAVLTVAISPQDPRSAHADAAPRLEADVVSLTGLRRPLALTRHDEPGGATWTAPVEVRHREPVTIEIRARTRDGLPLSARLTREFRLE
jgi:hypothetical protein